jgi:uncharacterized protein YqeY
MLIEEIKKDLISSLKDKKEIAISTLRMVISSVFNKEMEKRVFVLESEPNLLEEELKEKIRLTDEEVQGVIFSEIKKRRDSVLEFEKGGREDLVLREKEEINVLMKYMPKELTEDEIKKIVKEAIQKIENKDIGSLMKEISPQTKGKADGKLVSKIVKEELSK